MFNIKETYVNKTENYIIGETDYFETFTQNIKELFTSLQKEYGKCVSKVYRDIKGKQKVCGWVFEQLIEYEDSTAKYIRETWVELDKFEIINK